MKKIITAAIAALLLIGCGSAQSNTSSGNHQTTGKINHSGTIEEQVLYDTDGVLITASELVYEENRAKLLINVENNGPHEIKVLSGTLGYSCNAINNLMVEDGWINMTIPSGKKASDSAYFSYDRLIAYGISDIETIYMSLQIKDEEASTTITTDPLPIKTSLSANTDKSLTVDEVTRNIVSMLSSKNEIIYTDETELFNEAGIRIIGSSYFTLNDSKYLLLEVVNEGDSVVYVDTTDVSANGLTLCSGRWSGDSIIPGKKRYLTLDLASMVDKEIWDMTGITELSDIKLSFGVLTPDAKYIVSPQPLSFHVSENKMEIDTTGEEVYQGNGIRIISKGFVEDSLYINWELMVINDNDYNISVSDGWGDKLSINDYMVDYTMWEEYINAHETSFAEIQISKDGLEEIGITRDQFQNLEISLEVHDENYRTIANPTVSMTVNQ